MKGRKTRMMEVIYERNGQIKIAKGVEGELIKAREDSKSSKMWDEEQGVKGIQKVNDGNSGGERRTKDGEII